MREPRDYPDEVYCATMEALLVAATNRYVAAQHAASAQFDADTAAARTVALAAADVVKEWSSQ
jgi:hypothetical protein